MAVVLQQWQVSPPPGSVPSSAIPLTFFDLPWLLHSPNLPIFFYEFPLSTNHFKHTILPNLKHSLSLTLQHFFPFAGILKLPEKPNKPEILYSDGDSVCLTVAESNSDFDNLSGHHARNCREFNSLVPLLPARVCDDTVMLPLFAIQFTVFPNSGFCIGIAYRNVVADGRTFYNFMKFWASIVKFGENMSTLKELVPLHDRCLIKDPNGIEQVFLKQWWERETRSVIQHVGDMVRASFVMGQTDMEKIKNWILAQCKWRSESMSMLVLSPYVLTCAFVWLCLLKTRAIETKNGNIDTHYFGFIAGGITRLDYQVPASYFGNCIAFGRSMATRSELMGKEGLFVAAKAIGDAIKELNGDVLKRAKNWIEDWNVLYGSELHVTVSGSPKLEFYGLDFGWGRPKKIEELSIDSSAAISLSESRDMKGGIEVGLSLPKDKMDIFSRVFDRDLKVVQTIK